MNGVVPGLRRPGGHPAVISGHVGPANRVAVAAQAAQQVGAPYQASESSGDSSAVSSDLYALDQDFRHLEDVPLVCDGSQYNMVLTQTDRDIQTLNTDCGEVPAIGASDSGTAYGGSELIMIDIFSSQAAPDERVSTAIGVGIVPVREEGTWVAYKSPAQSAPGS